MSRDRSDESPVSTASFVVDVDREGRSRRYRYLCGACGSPLVDHATRELLDCIFVCPTCRSVNESPVDPSKD